MDPTGTMRSRVCSVQPGHDWCEDHPSPSSSFDSKQDGQRPSEKRPPRCVGCSTGGYLYPVEATWLHWSPPEDETGLGRRPAAFSGVAPPTGRNNIVPAVFAALHLGDNVVNILGRGAAVLTAVVIPHEYRSAGDRYRSCIRHRHISTESDDRWHIKYTGRRVPRQTQRSNKIRTLSQQKHNSPSCGDHRQRLVARIEDKCAGHPRIVPARHARTSADVRHEMTTQRK